MRFWLVNICEEALLKERGQSCPCWKNFPGPENISFISNPENPALFSKNQEKQQVVSLMQSGMSVAI